MSIDERVAAAVVPAPEAALRRRRRGELVGTLAFWLLGSAVVVVAQPDHDRMVAAAGAAVAGVATILVVSRLTGDRNRRYFRSLVGAMVAVSVSGDWIVRQLTGSTNSFQLYGLDTRIALPLTFVLLAPLVVRALPAGVRSPALWRQGALSWRQARPLDWVVVAYALLILPTLALGLAHHAPKTYIAQDLGLIVFFVFAYVAGRTVSAETGRASAAELIDLLLLLVAAQLLLGWDTTPIFTYAEAAAAGAIAFGLLQPRKTRLLPFGLALVVLGFDALAVKHGTGSTTAIELAGAASVIAYLAVRMWSLVPQWVVVGLAVAALAGFLAFTSDGATVRGQYPGPDPSNAGRSYEAYQVRHQIASGPVSLVFGRGLGGSIDETHAPQAFAQSLQSGGRDLAHVQEVHLLPYEFLLKYGLLGFAWLAALVLGLGVISLRALESAVRERDPTFVVYAALPLLGLAAALAAATHFQDNPLNAFGLGVLVTRLEPKRFPRLMRLALPGVALVCAVVGAIAFSGSVGRFVFTGKAAAGQAGAPPTSAAGTGSVWFSYPQDYHRRYFTSAKRAVTGAKGVRVNGVVVASYRLKASPELGGKGESFPSSGVFFELYETSRHPRLAPRARMPLTLADFHDVPRLNRYRSTEQGGTSFSVHHRNYRIILWVGNRAPSAAQLTITDLLASIRLK